MYYVGGRSSDHKMALKGLWLYLNFLIDHDATQTNLTYNELKKVNCFWSYVMCKYIVAEKSANSYCLQ